MNLFGFLNPKGRRGYHCSSRSQSPQKALHSFFAPLKPECLETRGARWPLWFSKLFPNPQQCPHLKLGREWFRIAWQQSKSDQHNDQSTSRLFTCIATISEPCLLSAHIRILFPGWNPSSASPYATALVLFFARDIKGNQNKKTKGTHSKGRNIKKELVWSIHWVLHVSRACFARRIAGHWRWGWRRRRIPFWGTCWSRKLVSFELF